MAGIMKDCPCKTKTDEEIKYEQVMENAWTRDPSGRLEVKLPWKVDPSTLSNNRWQAIQRDQRLAYQMARNVEIQELFANQVEEMISMGILKEVDKNYPTRYLPLLAVVDLNRESTKIRVCLDAKSRHQKLSINDALLKGKMEIPNIIEMITKFRCGKIALIGDIQKMYWQINLHKGDQKYHGVVWNSKTYVFTRVCFGEKPSSPIAEEAMLRISKDGKDTHSNA